MQGLGNGGPFAGLAGMAGGDLGGAAADVGSEVEASDLLLPGLDEALAFDELLKHIEDLRWDVVVFDTAPTVTRCAWLCPNSSMRGRTGCFA